jgi:hypothetical protein
MVGGARANVNRARAVAYWRPKLPNPRPTPPSKAFRTTRHAAGLDAGVRSASVRCHRTVKGTNAVADSVPRLASIATR